MSERLLVSRTKWFTLLAALAALLWASIARADVFMTRFEVNGLPGVFLAVHAAVNVPAQGQAFPGVIRIVDTNTGARYLDFAYVSYDSAFGVGTSTKTSSDVSVFLLMAPDGSYTLFWWDVLTGEFSEYAGTGAPFVIKP